MQNTFSLAVSVCCCLQIRNLVLNMAVKVLVLGQRLMVISTLQKYLPFMRFVVVCT